MLFGARDRTLSGRRLFGVCLLLIAISAITARAFHAGARYLQSANARSSVEARVRVASNPITPYTAIYEERVNSPAKKMSFTSARILEGVRADGAKVTRSEYYGVNGRIFAERTIYLPVDVVVRITEDTRTVVAEHRLEWNPQSTRRLDPQSGCTQDFEGRQVLDRTGVEDIVLGFRAIQLQRPNSKSASDWARWYLPQVACIEARQIVSFRDSSGAVTDTTERLLISLKTEPPPADLLRVPKEYDQVSPSESFKRRAAFLGGSIPPEQLAVLQNRDLYYYGHRADLSTLQ